MAISDPFLSELTEPACLGCLLKKGRDWAKLEVSCSVEHKTVRKEILNASSSMEEFDLRAHFLLLSS